VGAAERQVLSSHVPVAVAHLQPLQRLPGTNVLLLAIGLPLRNQEALARLIEQLYDPASPQYRRYLTPEQFTARFGPSQEDYQAVIVFAKAHDLTVTATHPNRVVVDVAGSASDIENAFQVALRVYPHPKEARTFYAPDREPSLDAAVPILHISGLDNYSLPHPNSKMKSLDKPVKLTPKTGSGPGGDYMGNDFRAAYVPGTPLTGARQTVGLLQFDGYYASDITAYEVRAGLPNVPLVNVPIDGGVTVPGGNNSEVCLDIEMVLSIAPGISKIYIYEAPNPSPWVDLLSRMANDNLSKQLSCSWSGGGPDPTAEGIFQQMAAQGQSFFTASGDSDAFTGAIDFPSESSNITLVGGTTLSTTGPHGGYVSETVWNWGNGRGSSGGISTHYPIPAYQLGINMVANKGSTSTRNVPDVALTADNVFVCYDNGSTGSFGGTSCAAPLWAGLTALINEQAVAGGRPAVGFLNPAIYAIGKGGDYAAAFHDITTGANTSADSPNLFYAVPGYDLCTGWGTPFGAGLIDALAGPPDALQISPPIGFVASGGRGGPFDTTAMTFYLTNTGAAALDWTLVNTSLWLSASSSSGTLAPGAASAVTIGLTSAASNLVVGTYSATLWFTNLSAIVAQSRTSTLTILGAPTITQHPGNQAVLAGCTATFTLRVIGLQPLSTQWRFSTNATAYTLPDATNLSLALPGISNSQAGNYWAVVTNSRGSATSTVAVLTVIPAAINDQCSGAIVISVNNYTNSQTTTNATSIGDPAPACVSGLGNGVWYAFTPPTNGQLVVDTIGSDFDTGLAVYTGACGTLNQVGCDDDSGGNLTSKITLSVSDGRTYHILVGGYQGHTGNLTFHLAFTSTEGRPVILAQPASQSVPPGGTATFSVSAAGTMPLSYFWERNGALIAGATASSYTTNNVRMADSGSQFRCWITNRFGDTNSAEAFLTVITPPANDACGNAIAITDDDYTNTQSTVLATSTGDPIPTCVAGMGGGVWYAFTRPTNGQLVVDTIGSDFDTGLAVYAGTCGTLNQVGCDDDSGGNLTSKVTLSVSAGTTYYILAGGYLGHTGNLTFHSAFTLITPPANDTCGNAIAITTANYTATRSTVGATSTGDPVPTCVAGMEAGVWYAFTPPTNGQLVVDTIGSDYDTGLAVYTGTCGTLTEVGCDDDSDGNLTSKVTLSVAAGTTYYILAGGSQGDTGNLTFHLAFTLITPPANDTCGNAIAITADNYTNTQSTVLATSTGDPIPTCVADMGGGVWYAFARPTNGQLVVDTIGSDFDTGLAVYTGTCGTLTEVGCDDDSGGNLTSKIALSVIAGTTYYILAGGSGGNAGILVFHLSFTGTGSTGLQNGGFETGDFSGWIPSGNTTGNRVTTDVAYVHSGAFGAKLGPSGSLGYLSQTVPTTAGMTYLFSFWLENLSGLSPNEFLVTWNGTMLFDQLNLGALAWTNLHFLVTATGTSTVLQFGFRHDLVYFGLDDISLTPLSGLQLDHFAWSPVASPQRVNHPFLATLTAQDTANATVTNLAGTVALSGTSSTPITPTASGNFIHGMWTGSITVQQVATNLVLWADDGSGHTGSSTPFQVLPEWVPAFTPGSPGYSGNGQFRFTLSGAAGSNYQILVSSDLKNWALLCPVLMISNTFDFLDSNANPTQRYYRACLVP
jgi:hypothetical protein